MTGPAIAAVLGIAGVIMTTILGLTGHLYTRLHKVEERNLALDRRVDELWSKRYEDARVIRKLGDHIDSLEYHVWQGLPPPPPPRPDDI